MNVNYEQRKYFKGVTIASGCPPFNTCFFVDDSLIFCRAKPHDCSQLRNCLDFYAKASGQLVHFNKSALSFSPNTLSEDRDAICGLFGISQVAGHNFYLGLPVFSLRNKRIQFDYIRDRVVGKLQGWKEKKIHKVERRVHWRRWQVLCKPKVLGGLGFKDLTIFNQALLGKQVWRFLQRPNSLVSHVFKAKYYSYSSIWEAFASTNASYIWKSILWGINLVAKGIRWRVGNGSSISIYNSR
ncbi:hypothetical protein UlMin_011944 [Ulmus minor]